MRNKFAQRGLILSMALLTLVFLAACGSSSNATMSDEDAAATAAANEASTNPPGVDRIESPVGSESPSSAAGGVGNTTTGGTNTNLNTEETTDSTTMTTETTTEVAETPPTPEPTMEVETVEEETHTMTTKD